MRPDSIGLNQLQENSQTTETRQKQSLNLGPSPPSNPPAVAFFCLRNLLQVPTRSPRKIKLRFLRQQMTNKILERMTRPTEKGHPSLAELSVNKMRFKQNPGSFSDTKSGLSQAYGLEPSFPTTDDNPPSEVSQYFKRIEDPLIKTMQVRRTHSSQG